MTNQQLSDQIKVELTDQLIGRYELLEFKLHNNVVFGKVKVLAHLCYGSLDLHYVSWIDFHNQTVEFQIPAKNFKCFKLVSH